MIRFSAQVASVGVAIALYSGASLAAEVPYVRSDAEAKAAPLYAVTPPRDFADVKLATYKNIGSQGVAVNPKNANVFLATYVSRFYSLQSSCWVHTSTNAGQTWGPPKKLPMPAGNPYCDRSALAWAPDGSRVYAAYSYWNRDVVGAGVAISSSTDKGLTWSHPTIVVGFNDSDAIGASVKLATPLNASDSSWLYILIAKNTYFAQPDSYYFGRSGDRGKTWEPLRNIFADNVHEGPANPSVAIAGGLGGEVLISYGYIVCDPPTCSTETHDIKVNHSSDRGVHFQEHIVAVPNAVGETAVAFGSAGTAHVIYTPWYERAPAFGPYYVYSTKAPYTIWSEPIALNADSPALYVSSPALTVSACGSGTSVLHAVWIDYGLRKNNVYYTRKVAKTGEEWSPRLRLSGPYTDNWDTPAIAAGMGSAVALWGKYYNPQGRVYTSRIAPGVTCP